MYFDFIIMNFLIKKRRYFQRVDFDFFPYAWLKSRRGIKKFYFLKFILHAFISETETFLSSFFHFLGKCKLHTIR